MGKVYYCSEARLRKNINHRLSLRGIYSVDRMISTCRPDFNKSNTPRPSDTPLFRGELEIPLSKGGIKGGCNLVCILTSNRSTHRINSVANVYAEGIPMA